MSLTPRQPACQRLFRFHSAALGALAAGLAVASPAHAESAPQAAAAPDPEILVTARKRPESAQSVPAALTVISGETLNAARTVNINQLSQLVPTLAYSSPNPRNTAFTLRGLGSSVVSISQANDGLEPGVGFYVDEVYHARPATAAFDFVDIDHVEVLRGPQGTLFGKNTTAGAISLTTKKPAFTYGAQAEFSYGNEGFTQAKAAITGPLIADKLAFRLSGSLTRRDGVIWNTVYKKWQNDVHNDALRGQLLWTPTSNFSLRLIGDWADFKGECCTQVYVRVAPTLKAATSQYAWLAAHAPGGAYAPPSLNPYDRVTDIDAGIGVNTDEGGASATAEWTPGAVKLTSITAWRFWDWDAANDRDYTGLPIQLLQHIPSRQDQYTQEFRIASANPGRVEVVAGLYYFNQRIVGHPISAFGADATYWLLPADYAAQPDLLTGYQSNGTTDFRTDSYALYGEATWHVLPRIDLTGGLRYTYESKFGSYDLTTSGGVTSGLTSAQASDKKSILRPQSYTATTEDGSASGRANLVWHLSNRMMAYASFAHAQKSGGINMSGLPVYPAGVAGHASGDPILSTAVVRPETVTTWETGFKGTARDGALSLNLTGYYTIVHDFQANVVDMAAVLALRSYLANIPRVTVKGIEAEASARLGSHVTLRAAGAYADGRYASYPAAPCPIEATGSATAVCDLSGKALPGLPKWTGSLSGEYHTPLRSGEVALRADAVARSRVYGEATDSSYTMIDGYTVVNASLAYRATAGWSVELFARNLLNANYLQNVTVQAGNSGLIVGTPSDPRLFGITLHITH